MTTDQPPTAVEAKSLYEAARKRYLKTGEKSDFDEARRLFAEWQLAANQEREIQPPPAASPTGVEARVPAMSDRPTPETDAVAFTVEHQGINNKWTTEQVFASFARNLERQRDEARAILAATLKALPVGYLPAHTPESIPDRVADLVARYAEAERQRDAYAETLRGIDLSGLIGNTIRDRHPELSP